MYDGQHVRKMHVQAVFSLHAVLPLKKLFWAPSATLFFFLPINYTRRAEFSPSPFLAVSGMRGKQKQ